jgi:2-dehydropantoate 2-reductase
MQAHHGDISARTTVSDALGAAAAKRAGKFENKSSMLVDIMKNRRTEIDYLNGYVVLRGHEANIPTPANEAMVSLVHDVEQGRLSASDSNLDVVLDRILSPK